MPSRVGVSRLNVSRRSISSVPPTSHKRLTIIPEPGLEGRFQASRDGHGGPDLRRFCMLLARRDDTPETTRPGAAATPRGRTRIGLPPVPKIE